MENQSNQSKLSNISEYVDNLLACNKVIFPAYYDSELRNKTEELSKKFKTNFFIETGSFDGRNTCILNEMQIFDSIHTIEIQEDLYNTFVLENNKGLDRVHCHLGDSVKILDEILSNLSNRDSCTIFLDAHGFELPLVNELEIIFKYCTKNLPVIIIHDFFVPVGDDYNSPRFPNYIHDGSGRIVKIDYIKEYLDKIYGVDGYVVEYATQSDLPEGGTGVLYLYPKLID